MTIPTTQTSNTTLSTDNETGSYWYQNILLRQKCGTKSQKNPKTIITTYQKTPTRTPPTQNSHQFRITKFSRAKLINKTQTVEKNTNTEQEYNTFCTNHINSTEIPTLASTKTKHLTRHPLTPYPCIPPFSSTMATTSTDNQVPTLTKPTSPTTNNTLLAIAKSISLNANPTNKILNSGWKMTTKTTKTTSTILRIPRLIPDTPSRTKTTPANKYCLPITIRIPKPKSTYGTFDHHRILTALLHAFQRVHPDANINPRLCDTEEEAHLIYHADEIPTCKKISTILKSHPTTTQRSSAHGFYSTAN
jgi:hypothetical protein